MGSEGQSLIMGVIVASGSLSRIIGPPVGDALMLLAGRRTYLVMLPMMGMLAAVFVGFLVLYRKLSPRTRRSPEEQKWSSEATVETNEFLNISIVGSEENLESVVEES
jgi:MFS family permease